MSEEDELREQTRAVLAEGISRGLLEQVRRPDGQYGYRLTEAGRRYAERLLGYAQDAPGSSQPRRDAG